MLKVNIVALGRDKDPWISEGIEHYTKLLARYCQLTVTNLPSLKKTASLSPAEVKKQEAERLLPYLEKTTPIALTDSGKTFDSRSFATFLGSLLASFRWFRDHAHRWPVWTGRRDSGQSQASALAVTDDPFPPDCSPRTA